MISFSDAIDMHYSQTGSECLLEAAQLLHIPQNVLTLVSLTDDDHGLDGHGLDGIYSYIVCTQKSLPKNTCFGPYKGDIISPSADSPSVRSPSVGSPSAGSPSVGSSGEEKDSKQRTRDNSNKNVNAMTVHLREEAANWLKILRTANNEKEANASIRVKGNYYYFGSFMG